MTEKSNIPPEPMDPLIEQAVDAIRHAPVPPMPPGVAMAAVAKMRLVDQQPRLVLLYERIRAMKPMNRSIAAASLLLAVGAAIALVVVMATRTDIAFADVKAQFQQAKTIQMTMSMPTPGATVPVDMRMKLLIKEPGQMRIELDQGVVTIIDIPAKKMLTLEPAKMEAVLLDIGQFPVGANTQPQNMLESIREYLDGSEQSLGERKIDGKSAQGFCVKKDSGEMELWVDKDSGDMAMIKITSHLPGAPMPSIILRDIVLNQEMPDSLFSLTPPPGYALKQQAMNMSNPVEDDLVAGLAMMASISDGRFPDNVSPGPELGISVEQAAKGRSDQEHQAMTQKVVRMILFVSLQSKNGFQYLGKGVKLGDAGKPIAWWRKSEGADYRVLFGDLSLKDLPASELPTAATAPASAPATMPSAEAGLVHVKIADGAGNNMRVGMLRPEVVLRVEKNPSAGSAATPKRVADLVIYIDDPRGQRARLLVRSPVNVAVYDDEAGTLATLDNLSAGAIVTVKPKAGTSETASRELVVELRDAEGKARDVNPGQ